MQALETLSFHAQDARERLYRMTDTDLDELSFGVIGFDRDTLVTAYNAFESHAAGMSKGRVLGRPLFDVIAPCMNNFMVAQRFTDALAAGTELDASIPYVLTLRMKPVKVELRLLASPDGRPRYVLVRRDA